MKSIKIIALFFIIQLQNYVQAKWVGPETILTLEYGNQKTSVGSAREERDFPTNYSISEKGILAIDDRTNNRIMLFDKRMKHMKNIAMNPIGYRLLGITEDRIVILTEYVVFYDFSGKVLRKLEFKDEFVGVVFIENNMMKIIGHDAKRRKPKEYVLDLGECMYTDKNSKDNIVTKIEITSKKGGRHKFSVERKGRRWENVPSDGQIVFDEWNNLYTVREESVVRYNKKGKAIAKVDRPNSLPSEDIRSPKVFWIEEVAYDKFVDGLQLAADGSVYAYEATWSNYKILRWKWVKN